ncbi:glycosyltransferase family 39 protein [Dacryopinax primogenitus]|uniref:Dolichyl-phosphate-mannose--protein mannosyltransferase n=1 Tax=Dacryopinax primogenitus (strain DJM 731) TaxID=1858805 RepID=M5FRI6_DACPD|nr:glycosyltransferase family 39 protein [Dacryopinax primogenitus]EJT98298.1 glycosyltransferase family 39 protein [Dacryopinax primogenitus]
MAEESTRRRNVSSSSYGNSKKEEGFVYDDQSASQDDADGKGLSAKHAKFLPRGQQHVRPRRLPPPSTLTEFIQQNWEWIPPVIYTLLAAFTRYYQIGKSNVVVWDEAHFGKFGSHYLKRDFYFDVHPPLGKMLVGLAGLLSGYDGSFEFKSGEAYPSHVPYTAMRVILATFGVGMVPIGWFTAVELGFSQRACHLVTLMVLCDCAWATISRFILLDSMLLFFTFTTVFGLTKFHNQQWRSFSFEWWFWLAFTGVSIGCVDSVKWVGFFVTALVGLYTIEDLWEKFGDLQMPIRIYLRHWAARILCLIITPFMVYLASFKIHFLILNHSGPGDAQMSSLFQANLRGNDFSQNPLEVAYGSKITLKNMGWGGGLLHSHPHSYPTGSQQQQVTCYHYKDDNNHWLVMPRWDEKEYDPNGDLRFLQDGDTVRLIHASTGRNMHSHPLPAPITKLNNEVSCYGNATVGDHQDHWAVEVVDDLNMGSKDKVHRIHSLTTRLRLKHVAQGCYLRAANAILPQWGWKQVEVSCVKENNPRDAHTYWNVESHWNDRLPRGEVKLYRSPFFRDFWHLNVAMMTSNNALIPDPDKEDILASTPYQWPWLNVGLRMCGWGDQQIKYYLLGNPIVWWSGTASLLLSLVALGVYLLRMQRRYNDFEPGQWDHVLYVGKVALIGWFLHYFPFLAMGRVTYIHHYLPALWFSVLMTGHLLDHFIFKSKRLSERTKWTVFIFCALAVIETFLWFRGIVFGIEGPIQDYKGLLWRKSWNIY